MAGILVEFTFFELLSRKLCPLSEIGLIPEAVCCYSYGATL